MKLSYGTGICLFEYLLVLCRYLSDR
jgi:hypothetical protein